MSTPRGIKGIPREHFNFNGQPKTKYDSEAEALLAIVDHPHLIKAYKCSICKGWHTSSGGSKKTKPRKRHKR